MLFRSMAADRAPIRAACQEDAIKQTGGARSTVNKVDAAPAPWKPGMPTAPEFKIANPREFEAEKKALRDLVERFGAGGPSVLTTQPHPFFGPLTAEEWQALQWRHLDHHLRQFSA